MEDLLRSIKAFLYERAVSPLAGAFIIAWLVSNYRVIVILLSDVHFRYKFAAIDEYFSIANISKIEFLDQNFGYVYLGLARPVILAGFYIFLYPLLAIPVYNFTLFVKQKLRRIKQKVEKEKLLSLQESTKLLTQIDEIQDIFSDEAAKWMKEKATFIENIESLEKEIYDFSHVTIETETGNEAEESKGSSLSEEHKQVLQLFLQPRRTRGVVGSIVSAELGLHIEHSHLLLAELSTGNYIDYIGDSEHDDAMYQLSTLGQRTLVDLGLIPKFKEKDVQPTVATITNLEPDELEDYGNSIAKHGLKETDFQRVEVVEPIEPGGVRPTRGSVTFTYRPTAQSRKYTTGDQSNWPYLFETDLSRGVFQKK